MNQTLHWTCPFCSRDTTITKERMSIAYAPLTIPNAEGKVVLQSLFIVCPNPKCKKTTLTVSLHEFTFSEFNQPIPGLCLHEWHLIPASRALAFPGYVPQTIINDYNEACLIQDTSSKASATLSRRCLQGIIRDFWKVKAGRLVDEIEQIKEKIDPLTWEAIDSVRKVGNIGAHMEKDINLIVDVEPNEAQLLISLIETLIRDWYVSREERNARLLQIKEVADQKDREKKGTAKVS